MTQVREICDEVDMVVIGEVARAEGVTGRAGEVDPGNAPSGTRSYVVTIVPTRPQGNRAS